MKRILSLLLLLFLMAGAKAQTIDTLFKESFEGKTIKFSGEDFNGCTSKWIIDTSAASNGKKCIVFSNSQTCPDYLFSTPVTLAWNGPGDSVTVYYDVFNDNNNYGDSLFIEMVDTGSKVSFAHTLIPINNAYYSSSGWATYSFTVSVKDILSYHSRPNFRMVFAGICTGYGGGLGYIFLDNIRMVEQKHGMPGLTFTTPKTTDTIISRSIMNIAWTDSNLTGSYIDIDLINSTNTFTLGIASSISASSGSTTGNLYNSLTPGYYRLAAVISGTYDTISYSKPFYVMNPYIKILNPKGNETYYAGKTIVVKWTSKAVSKLELQLLAASTNTTTVLDASINASQDSTTLLLPKSLTWDNYNMIASDLDNNGYNIGDTTSNFIIDTGKAPSGIMTFSNNTLPLSLYPNPSNGSFTINVPLINGQGVLEIFSAEGKEIFSRNVNSGERKMDININETGLPAAGLYMVRLKTASAIYQSKISLN